MGNFKAYFVSIILQQKIKRHLTWTTTIDETASETELNCNAQVM